MNVLRILRRLMLAGTPAARISSDLFDCYCLEMCRSALSLKTPIPKADSVPDQPSVYRRRSRRKYSRQPLRPYSTSTAPTSETNFLIRVISSDGKHKASFYGTRSQLAGQVSVFLMTGKNIHPSPERSLSSLELKGLYSSSADQSPSDTSNTSTKPETPS